MEKLKLIASVLVIFAVIMACGKSRDKNDDDDDTDLSRKIEKYTDGEDEEAEEEKELKIIYGSPYILQNSNYLMIPLRVADIEENFFGRLKEKYFSPDGRYYSKYSDGFNKFNYGNMYNVVYYNSQTGSSYSLLTRKALINQFYIPAKQNADTSRGRFIIFTLIEEDYNNDEEIDEDDGETVYKCSILGQDIRQISPERVRLVNFDVDTKSDAIYLYVTEDTDANKKYNEKDETKILRTSITESNIATEILSDSLKNSMNILYNNGK